LALGKIFIILGALLSILGTYIFAIYGVTGSVGSGIGFITNLGTLFGNAASIAAGLGIEVIVFYLFVIIFLIFLAAGILQFIGLKSKVAGLIFSLFPLGVGIMLILTFYTDILGLKAFFFTIVFIGEQYGNIFPILVDLGGVGLGVYLILGGGVLGFIGSIMPRD